MKNLICFCFCFCLMFNFVFAFHASADSTLDQKRQNAVLDSERYAARVLTAESENDRNLIDNLLLDIENQKTNKLMTDFTDGNTFYTQSEVQSCKCNKNQPFCATSANQCNLYATSMTGESVDDASKAASIVKIRAEIDENGVIFGNKFFCNSCIMAKASGQAQRGVRNQKDQVKELLLNEVRKNRVAKYFKLLNQAAKSIKKSNTFYGGILREAGYTDKKLEEDSCQSPRVIKKYINDTYPNCGEKLKLALSTATSSVGKSVDEMLKELVVLPEEKISCNGVEIPEAELLNARLLDFRKSRFYKTNVRGYFSKVLSYNNSSDLRSKCNELMNPKDKSKGVETFNPLTEILSVETFKVNGQNDAGTYYDNSYDRYLNKAQVRNQFELAMSLDPKLNSFLTNPTIFCKEMAYIDWNKADQSFYYNFESIMNNERRREALLKGDKESLEKEAKEEAESYYASSCESVIQDIGSLVCEDDKKPYNISQQEIVDSIKDLKKKTNVNSSITAVVGCSLFNKAESEKPDEWIDELLAKEGVEKDYKEFFKDNQQKYCDQYLKKESSERQSAQKVASIISGGETKDTAETVAKLSDREVDQVSSDLENGSLDYDDGKRRVTEEGVVSISQSRNKSKKLDMDEAFVINPLTEGGEADAEIVSGVVITPGDDLEVSAETTIDLNKENSDIQNLLDKTNAFTNQVSSLGDANIGVSPSTIQNVIATDTKVQDKISGISDELKDKVIAQEKANGASDEEAQAKAAQTEANVVDYLQTGDESKLNDVLKENAELKAQMAQLKQAVEAKAKEKELTEEKEQESKALAAATARIEALEKKLGSSENRPLTQADFQKFLAQNNQQGSRSGQSDFASALGGYSGGERTSAEQEAYNRALSSINEERKAAASRGPASVNNLALTALPAASDISIQSAGGGVVVMGTDGAVYSLPKENITLNSNNEIEAIQVGGQSIPFSKLPKKSKEELLKYALTELKVVEKKRQEIAQQEVAQLEVAIKRESDLYQSLLATDL